MTQRTPSTRTTPPRTSLSYNDIKAIVFTILAGILFVVYMMPDSNASHSTSFSITTGGKLFTNDKTLASGKDCLCGGAFYLCNATEPELSHIKNQSSDALGSPQGTKPFWEIGGKGEQAGDICKNGGDEETQHQIEEFGDLFLKLGGQDARDVRVDVRPGQVSRLL